LHLGRQPGVQQTSADGHSLDHVPHQRRQSDRILVVCTPHRQSRLKRQPNPQTRESIRGNEQKQKTQLMDLNFFFLKKGQFRATNQVKSKTLTQISVHNFSDILILHFEIFIFLLLLFLG
jgi:hypothetical protein